MNLKKSIYYVSGLFLFTILALIVTSSCKKEDDENKNTNTNTNTSSFCYSLTKSTVAYDTISNGTELINTNADDIYVIDLGYTFTFCGTSFSKIYIDSWTYEPTFTYDVSGGSTDLRGYELSVFGSLVIEPYGNGSGVFYQTTGSSGNHVTTIEWKNFDYSPPGDTETYIFDFEVKLYESGNKIAYIYGPNDVSVNFTSISWDQMIVGLYSTDQNNGLFLYGNPTSPTTASAPGSNELTTWPDSGTKYLFQ